MSDWNKQYIIKSRNLSFGALVLTIIDWKENLLAQDLGD